MSKQADRPLPLPSPSPPPGPGNHPGRERGAGHRSSCSRRVHAAPVARVWAAAAGPAGSRVLGARSCSGFLLPQSRGLRRGGGVSAERVWPPEELHAPFDAGWALVERQGAGCDAWHCGSEARLRLL